MKQVFATLILMFLTVSSSYAAEDTSSAAPDQNGAFSMRIEDVFNIPGTGIVVVGKIERGVITVGDGLEITGGPSSIKTKCIAMEIFRKSVDKARAGENVAIMLSDVKREQVTPGQILRASQ
jgi:elongation factor Tu